MPTVYEIGGRRIDPSAAGFADAIAAAHSARQRPLCLCVRGGVEMYVARLAGTEAGYVVKRMPDSGSRHRPHCPSYEPPPELSWLGQVLGSAIVEDPATGETALKLDFPLLKMAGRSTMPPPGGDGDSVGTDGARLSLRGLLHYLWDQAELTRWQPGFAGRRTWGTVRRHLLLAAEHKVARGHPLRARLYVPEAFVVQQREAINGRRMAQWSHAVGAPGKPQQLMLLIGEVKEIVPARYGYKAVVRHLPDQAFLLDEPLYRRLGRRFEAELALWGGSDDIHMVMVATFGLAASGVPTIVELSLMPVTRQWLPVADGFEKQLVERLVAEGRSFVKGLRYNLGAKAELAAALLTDVGDEAVALWVDVSGLVGFQESDEVDALPNRSSSEWRWHARRQEMPRLPAVRAGGRRTLTPGEAKGVAMVDWR